MARRPRIAVVDHGIGNLHSARKAHDRSGADAVLTSDPATIAAADGVVLPGVGNFGACMQALRRRGLEQVVVDATGRVPFLGICVGAQMLFDGSDESPEVRGLGVIPGRVELIATTLKRPHMQWNVVSATGDDPMLDGLGATAAATGGPWFYFVHSYQAVPADQAHVAATCDYGGRVNAAFRSGGVFATQFHPEKSGRDGLALIANFVRHVSTARSVT